MDDEKHGSIIVEVAPPMGAGAWTAMVRQFFHPRHLLPLGRELGERHGTGCFADLSGGSVAVADRIRLKKGGCGNAHDGSVVCTV